MQESLQPMGRARASRRSRPSLSAMVDSGYEPSKPKSISRHSLAPKSISRNGNNIFKSLSSRTLPRSFSFAKNTFASSSDNMPETADPDPFDLGIASKLLADDSLLKDPKASVRTSRNRTMGASTRSFPFSVDGGRSAPKSISGGSSGYPITSNTVSRSQTISSVWSTMSNRLFTESVKSNANEKPVDVFTKEFDKLAKKHGIQPFPESHRAEPTSVSVSSASVVAEKDPGDTSPVLPGNKFWNKIRRRTPSNVDISKRHGNMKMSLTRKRAVSISDLAAIARGKRDSLKGMHLEDIIRLGGVSLFNLPLGLSPGDLLIPTCMHAAAAFILNNGLETPGLFRISGNLNTTYELYDYYQRQLEDFNEDAVEQTTSLSTLPTHIQYNVYDVAHLFKKLLHGLPGGLLGSPAVFQALYNIHEFVYPDPSIGENMSRKVKPRMIALAIASINLHFRISLICAVFGLLRAVTLASEQETENKIKDPHETFSAMKDDALGILFGPLLLGDKSDQILGEELEDRGGLLVLPKISPVPNVSPKRSKYTRKVSSAYNKIQLEKTKRAALVCEMLINSWEDICAQLRRIDALGITAEAYDLPKPREHVQETFESIPEEKPRAPSTQRGSVRGSMRGSMRGSRSESRVASYGTKPHRDESRNSRHTPEPDTSHHHSHHIHFPSLHEPHLEDLMRFSTRGSREEPDTLAVSSVPLVSGPGMSPVPELTSPEMSPAHTLGDSPNWRVFAPSVLEEPDSPIPRIERPLVIERARKSTPPQVQFDLQDEEIDEEVSSGLSTGPSSPGLDVTAQIATRFHRKAIEVEIGVVDELSFSAPEPLESTMFKDNQPRTPRRAISPIPDLAFSPQRDVMSDPETTPILDRPTTPKPLRLRKGTKTQPVFSIFEDHPKDEQRPLPSPTLTITRPNSKVEIKLNPKGTHPSPTRRLPESPTRPSSKPLQPSTPNRKPRRSLDMDFEDRYIFQGGETPSPTKKAGNSALYAEIRRLQRLVDLKTEEANATRKELEMAKSMANAGTLSYMVKEAQNEAKVWRNRAEWAEKQLRTAAAAERTSATDAHAPAPLGTGFGVTTTGNRQRYSLD